MTIAITPTPITDNFNDVVFDLLKPMEAFIPRVYTDAVGVPTLGVGYALVTKQLIDGNLQWALRPSLETELAVIGVTLSVADQAVLEAMAAVLNANPPTNGEPNPLAIAANNLYINPLQPGEQFNSSISAANNPFPDVNLISLPNARTLFDYIIPDYIQSVRDKFGIAEGCAFDTSMEMVALVSMMYNGPGRFPQALVAALQKPDANAARAEAWCQIRYFSRGGATRQYAEAAMFGLYDPSGNVAEDAALSIYRMYSKHSQNDELLNYDIANVDSLGRSNRWLAGAGVGVTAQSLEYSLEDAANLLIANYGQNKTFTPLNIWVTPKEGGTISREGRPRPTEDALFIGDVGVDNFTGGSGNDVMMGGGAGDTMTGGAGDDVLAGEAGEDTLNGGENNDTMTGGADNDKLNGDAGDDTMQGDAGDDIMDGGADNDRLIGGEGSDKLTGGTGDDTLIGGEGNDTYIYKNGDGSDSITDRDGSIQYDGDGLSGGFTGDKEGESKKATKAGTYKSEDEKYTYVWGGPGRNLIINGSITVKNFNNGDLGITLNERKKKDDDYDNAQNIPNLCDPLTLDLNGNGIETVPTSTPPLFFDLNADGIKTSSGWIAPSDGLLVMDRNGNGMIDNGAELFGDATPAYSAGTTIPGTGKTADGFAALAQEDSNADGVVNNQDANWANLSVWQDLNQDGISQPEELKTLTELGIESFSTTRTDNLRPLPGGNQLADLGTFTRVDGSTGNTGAPQGMADINLVVDTWHRTFADTIPTTPETENLPDMQGSGKVRDLREAASLQTPAGQALAAKLTRFAQATTRTEQMAMLDDLLSAWGATSGFSDMKTRAAQHGYTLTVVGHLTPLNEKHLNVLEQFNGRSFYKMPWEGATMAQSALQGLRVGWDGNPKHLGVGWSWVLHEPLLERAYTTLKEDLYQELLAQTRLKPYLDLIEASVNAAGEGYLNFSGVQDAISQQISLDPVKGVGDLIDLNNYCNANYSGTMWQSQSAALFRDTMQNISITPVIQQLLTEAGLGFGTDGTNGNDMLFADDAGGTILAFAGNDSLVSGKGSDMLIGGTGSDTYSYQRGDGADTIVDSVGAGRGVMDSNTLQLGVGITAADITVLYDTNTQTVLLDLGNGDNIHIGSPADLAVQQIQFADGSKITTDALLRQKGMLQNGTDGADILTGSDSALYGDVLNGGAGDDTLNGGAGSDTYIYNLGDGVDTIVDSGAPSYNYWTGQHRYANNNILKFGAGIDATMVTPSFDSSTQTAVLTLPDGGRIDIGPLNDLSIQTLQFADDSTVSIAALFSQQLLEQVGTADADVLTGANSTIYGDHLLGLGGDDELNGGAGSDVLEGGVGNDTLQGGMGNDTYVYNLGDGADTIVDAPDSLSYWAVGNTLNFGTGITADLLTPRFDSATQTVTLDLGNGDSIQIGILNNSAIQTLLFADGTTQHLGQFLDLKGLTVSGTNGDDVLVGSGINDILIGGAGNDLLDGGTGADTYVFNVGDGADTIIDDSSSGNILKLGAGITRDTILPRLDGVTGDVRLEFGNGDSIVVGNYDASQLYLRLSVGQIKFADDTTTQLSQLLSDSGLLVEGTNIADTLQGAISHQNRMYGLDGNDTLIGGQRDDELDGGAGNDTLDAGYGNDLLTGGLGDDSLSGGEGNDVYVYNLGDGADVVIDSAMRGQINAVRLGSGTEIQSVEYQGTKSGDLILHFADGGSLRIADIVADDAVTTSSIQRFELADGTVLSAQELLSQFEIQVEGTDIDYWWEPLSGSDSLNGTNLDDYISGYSGNDTLLGGAGDDVLDGGSGNDTLSGDAGNDTLLGADGDDVLYGREGDDELIGEWGNDELQGGAGNDVLEGGYGNDVMQGGAGDDTYRFNRYDGEDLISDSAGTDVLQFGAGIAQADLIFSKLDVHLRIALPDSGGSVVLENWFTGTNTVNTLLFEDGSTFDLLSIAQSVVDQPVLGTDGDDTLQGSIYNDTLVGGQGNDTLIGGTGDDVYRFDAGDGVDRIYELSAMAEVAGNDTIEFGAGITADMLNLSLQVQSLEWGQTWWGQTAFPDPDADLMHGDQQRQVMNIQIGNQGDVIQVMSGKGAIEKFRFDDGTEYTWQEMFELQGGGDVIDSNDQAWTNTYQVWNGTNWVTHTQTYAPHRMLDGTGLSAIFDGGIGNDTILGGMQDDVYLFNLGDGQDVIADFGGQDEIAFGAGITSADLSWQYNPASGTPFVLNVGAYGDSLSILDGENGAIERFRFDDGSVLTFAELLDNQGGLVIEPPSTIGDYFNGWQNNNLIVGTDGGDHIYDGGDSSFIVGGKGDDVIELSGSRNTVLFEQGDGQDEINVDANSFAPASTLLFGPDVDPASLKCERFQRWNEWNGYIQHGIRIEYGSLGDAVVVYGAMYSPLDGGYDGGEGYISDAPVIRIQFADGTAWSYEDLLARAENVIFSADSYDTTLVGTGGNDTYVIDGQESEYTIVDAAGPGNFNTAALDWDFANGIAMGPLADRVTLEDEPFSAVVSATRTNPYTLSTVGGSLVMQFDNGMTLNIDGFDPADPLGSCAIREFRFADGTVLGIDQILSAGIEAVGTDAADVLVGTAVNDMIDGLAGDDAITGGAGNDVLRGGTGSDTYVFNRGDGADTIEDAAFYWGHQQLVIDNNVLNLGAGIDLSAVAVIFDASKNKIYLDCGSGDSICIGQPGNFSVQTVQFNDGTEWDEWMMTDRMTVGTMADPNPELSAGISYTATLANGDDLPAWLAFDGATGKFSGTPGNDDVGMLDVAVTATDVDGNNTISNFALDVLNVNDAPTVGMALADQSTMQDASFSFAVPADAFDDADFIHGDMLSYSATLADGTTLPSWLTFDATTQTFSGTPLNEDVGVLNVAVTATDMAGASVAAAFALDVVNVNDAPVAVADTAAVQEDLGITAIGNVLANDSDVDQGTVLQVANAGVFAGQYGQLTLNADGSYTYVLDSTSLNVQSLAAGQIVTETFAYQATDGIAFTPATLTVNITGTNTTPVVVADTATAQEDLGITASGNVLSNDSDVDQGTVLQVANAGVFAGQYGQLTLNADGSYSYVLDNASANVQSLAQGQTVTETFAYQATDGIVVIPSTLTVSITGTNDAPIVSMAIADQSTLEDALFSYTIPAGTFDDADFIHGDSLSYAVTLADGSALPSWLGFDAATQTFSGTPGNADVGMLNARVTATDQAGASVSATFALDVVNVNDAPVASDDAVTASDTATAISIASLLANDYDIDVGDTFTLTGFDAITANGNTVMQDAAGNFVFDIGNRYQYLGTGQSTTDSFTYTITDTAGATSTASVNVTITGTNDAPVVVADTATAQEDLGITATGNVLANDSDVDQGTVLQVANAGIFAGQYGQLELLADGSYTYQLDNTSASVQSLAAGQTISETFAYEATDGLVSTPSALTVSIIGTNDAPAVVADTASVREDLDITATGNVLANDSDVDQGSVLSVADAGTKQGLYGSLTLGADGSYTYQLDNASQAVQSLGRNARVTEHFGYTVTDGIAGTASGLDILIQGSNDAPVLATALSDHEVVSKKAFTWQMPEGSFTDIDTGDTLAYTATQANGTALPSWLTFDAATRTFSGQAPKQTGSIDVMVTATDVAADGSTAGSLAASDVFRVTVEHGNEGVGNGEDAPPPGHDCNQNDGHGTSPGNPGSHDGHGHHSSDDHRHDNHHNGHTGESHADGKKDDCIDDLIRDWFKKGDSADHHGNFDELGRGDNRIDHQANRNVAHGISNDYSKQWAHMNARLKEHLAQSGNDDHFETGASHGSPGLFGTGGSHGISQLGKSEGVQMKAFAGLKEGLERLGC